MVAEALKKDNNGGNVSRFLFFLLLKRLVRDYKERKKERTALGCPPRRVKSLHSHASSWMRETRDLIIYSVDSLETTVRPHE